MQDEKMSQISKSLCLRTAAQMHASTPCLWPQATSQPWLSSCAPPSLLPPCRGEGGIRAAAELLLLLHYRSPSPTHCPAAIPVVPAPARICLCGQPLERRECAAQASATAATQARGSARAAAIANSALHCSVHVWDICACASRLETCPHSQIGNLPTLHSPLRTRAGRPGRSITAGRTRAGLRGAGCTCVQLQAAGLAAQCSPTHPCSPRRSSTAAASGAVAVSLMVVTGRRGVGEGMRRSTVRRTDSVTWLETVAALATRSVMPASRSGHAQVVCVCCSRET